MRLIQIPFSHNCIKVRLAIETKGLAYETLDVRPMDRRAVRAASGQGLVPVLEDCGRAIHDSTAILRYLEDAYPEPSLLPHHAAQHAECWLLEDWADRAFMELTRRIAYWQRLKTPAVIAERFFPGARGWKRKVGMVVVKRALTRRFGLSAERNALDEKAALQAARLALGRLAGKPYFFQRITVADIALAAMTAPLWVAAEPVRDDPDVRALLEWGRPILGESVLRMYGVTG